MKHLNKLLKDNYQLQYEHYSKAIENRAVGIIKKYILNELPSDITPEERI